MICIPANFEYYDILYNFSLFIYESGCASLIGLIYSNPFLHALPHFLVSNDDKLLLDDMKKYFSCDFSPRVIGNRRAINAAQR